MRLTLGGKNFSLRGNIIYKQQSIVFLRYLKNGIHYVYTIW